MTPEFAELPESLLRLDELLAAAGDDAMMLPELDGFLCCVAVSPDAIALEEWWPFSWIADERGNVSAAHEELATLIKTRLAEIETELAAEQYAPLFEVDEESDEVIWQTWLAGFQEGMHLRFDAWDELLRYTGEDAKGEAAQRLASGLMLMQPDVVPDDTAGEEEWAEYDEAMEETPESLAVLAMQLHQIHKTG